MTRRMVRPSLAAVFVAIALAAPAQAQSPIEFPAQAVPFSVPAFLRQTVLFRPSQGSGPFPAVVILPTCGGVQRHIYDWAERFTDAGYAVLVIDSLTPRNFPTSCGKAPNLRYEAMAQDVAAGIAYLRTRPEIDGSRLGLVGFSHGAGAALRMASGNYRRQARISLEGLRAIAVFYPWCATAGQAFVGGGTSTDMFFGEVATPTRLFLGAIDTETPAGECTYRVDRLAARGQPIAYKLYPDTTHYFDAKENGLEGRRNQSGVLYRYSPGATEDAWREVKALFDHEVKGAN